LAILLSLVVILVCVLLATPMRQSWRDQWVVIQCAYLVFLVGYTFFFLPTITRSADEHYAESAWTTFYILATR